MKHFCCNKINIALTIFLSQCVLVVYYIMHSQYLNSLLVNEMQSHTSSSKLNDRVKLMPRHQKSLRHASSKAPSIVKSVAKETNNVNKDGIITPAPFNPTALGPSTEIKSSTLTNNINKEGMNTHAPFNQSALRSSIVIKSPHLTTISVVSTQKKTHKMKIKIALFNDRLIETQWGENAIINGHGFSGYIPCDLISSCILDIISSTNKYADLMAFTWRRGNRLVSML